MELVLQQQQQQQLSARQSDRIKLIMSLLVGIYTNFVGQVARL
jgi:hypothetical protein